MSKIRDDTDDFRDDLHDAGDTRAGPEPPEGDTPIHLHSPARGRRPAPKATPAPGQKAPSTGLTDEQRLLVLDLWRRSGLPAGDFAPLVGLSKYTLYECKRRFEAGGPAGLAERPLCGGMREQSVRAGHSACPPPAGVGILRLAVGRIPRAPSIAGVVLWSDQGWTPPPSPSTRPPWRPGRVGRLRSSAVR